VTEPDDALAGHDEPRPLGAGLDSLLRSLRQAPDAGAGEGGRSGARTMGGVFGRWDEVVGPAVARHVQPIRLDGSSLVVEVAEPAWATQLRFLEATLKERLRQETGAVVDTIEVRVRRPRSASS
jgi:predicted nucleic acid-binding Zn ribbon protein